MPDYSLGDVARILKVSPRRLRYWQKTELLSTIETDSYEPVIGSDVELEGAVDDAEGDDSDEGYAFRDLVVLRAIVSLVDKGIPLQRIRSNLGAESWEGAAEQAAEFLADAHRLHAKTIYKRRPQEFK